MSDYLQNYVPFTDNEARECKVNMDKVLFIIKLGPDEKPRTRLVMGYDASGQIVGPAASEPPEHFMGVRKRVEKIR